MLIYNYILYSLFRGFTLLLGKAKRLKQAKEEAQAEIDTYRKEREREFKKYEESVSNQ